jgi:excisionase family DNA binding protein
MPAFERVVATVDGDLAANLAPHEQRVIATLVDEETARAIHTGRPPRLDPDVADQLRAIAFARSASGPIPRRDDAVPSLSTTEVAMRLGLRDSSVRRLCRSGALPADKPGRDWRVPVTALVTRKEAHDG